MRLSGARQLRLVQVLGMVQLKLTRSNAARYWRALCKTEVGIRTVAASALRHRYKTLHAKSIVAFFTPHKRLVQHGGAD